MARQRCLLAAGACGLTAAILFYSPALAFDLNGMWASDTGNCEKIFARETSPPFEKIPICLAADLLSMLTKFGDERRSARS